MMSRRRVSIDNRNRAVGMLQAGVRQIDVAAALGVSQSVVSRIHTRFLRHGNVADRPRSGRPRITTSRQDRYLTVSARRTPSITSSQLRESLRAASHVTVCTQTVRNRLHEYGLRSRRPLRCIALTSAHRRQRFTWVQQYMSWTTEWHQVLFTDESRFALYPDTRRGHVWRRSGTRMQPHNVQSVHPYQRQSVMVWAGVCFNGRTTLYVCQGYMNASVYRNEIIVPIVTLFHAAIGHAFRFLDDNATCHRARSVLQELENHGIESLQLPPRSPDLNPIENIWDAVQRRLDNHVPYPSTLADLRNVLPVIWDELPQTLINNVIASMPRRCQDVLRHRGGVTGY